MRFLKDWWNKSKRSPRTPNQRAMPRVESLETRDLMSASPMPVLMVIANQDFFYSESSTTRSSLEAAGLGVAVAAASTQPAIPHNDSGQGPDSTGEVLPDLALAEVDAADYSAIVFVGGWGASSYQYAFNDPNFDGVADNCYWNPLYNGEDITDGTMSETKVVVNDLINDFVAQDKYVCGLCHGVTVLAWAEVDGNSSLNGRQVAVPVAVGAPGQFFNGVETPNMYLLGQYDQVIANGAIASAVPGQIGDPTTSADDVVIDGRIITGENFDAALHFGEVVARSILADVNSAPQVEDDTWALGENAPAGTLVGTVSATDPDAGQTLSYSIVGGNTNGAFAIDPSTGAVTVANPAAIKFEAIPTFT